MICGEWLKVAKQGVGKSMGNRECEWIGARLPLWVDNGDCNGSIDVHGERGRPDRRGTPRDRAAPGRLRQVLPSPRLP